MTSPWLFRMRWLDLLFVHWPVDADSVQARLPQGLELETFEGRPWVGVVPFTMADVAPRGVPAFPRFSRFPEVNVRTYVRHRGLPGVWFFSLDAASWPTVVGGRSVFHLPYHHGTMSSRRHVTGFSEVLLRRGRLRFSTRFWPDGPIEPGGPGSFDEWSTDRRRLFSVDGRGHVWRSEIDHQPWPLQPAGCTMSGAKELIEAAGLKLALRDDETPVMRFSRRLDVHGWPPVRG